MRHPLSLVTAAGAFAALVTFSPSAAAGIEECGNHRVEADAQCELLFDGDCVAQCEPSRLAASCAAELYSQCSARCDRLPAIDCQGQCQASCVGDCGVDPRQFDCATACDAECLGQCDAACGAGDTRCRASCEGVCSILCDTSCLGASTGASCEGKCEAGCAGLCRASSSLECQLDCQAERFADCEDDLRGRCEAACVRPQGALFCDGQYVDDGGPLDACVGGLQDRYEIDVERYGDVRCANDVCAGDTGGRFGCAIDRNAPIWGGFGVATMILLLTASRRRSSRRTVRDELVACRKRSSP